MAGFAAGSRLHEYYNSPKHSDVTLWFGSHETKAHKVVLSQASDYFRASFEGEFREAKSPLFKLADDDPRTVKGMISWIYGLYYDGQHSFSRVKPTVTCTPVGFNYLTYCIDLYVTAAKYLVVGLQHSIIVDFRKNLSVLAQPPGLSSYIDQISRQVYHQHAEAAKPLRTHVLGVVAASFNRLEGDKDTEAFKKLMLDVPELSWDLLLKMGQDNEEWRMLASQDG